MAEEHRPLIRIRDVSLAFGQTRALDQVDLSIAQGAFFTLLGPSGCGKTSLLRLIAGLHAPTSGSILLEDRDMTADPPHRRPVNTVFQNYALFPHLSVGRNVSFGLEMLGWPAKAIQARVGEALALVGLEAYGERMPEQLSGGQQQRVALARALAPRPRVLLLDEPMSALDLKLRKETQQELKRLHREAGITFILVTHDQEEALTLSDQIAIMQGGRVRQVGSPEEVYHRPSNRFVADFIGEANLIDPAALGCAATGKVVMVRPENVAIVAGEGRVRGVVRDVRFFGGGIEVTVEAPNGASIRSRRSGGDIEQHRDTVGRSVGLDWACSSERLLDA